MFSPAAAQRKSPPSGNFDFILVFDGVVRSSQQTMKSFLCIILLALSLPVRGFAAGESDSRIQYSASSLEDVLFVYSKASKRKVWVENGVRATIAMEASVPTPVLEVLESIRTTLMEKHGIEVKDAANGETFVSWTTDPKYAHLTRHVTKISVPDSGDAPRKRIRVLNSSTGAK
jgi:hypothetical protein